MPINPKKLRLKSVSVQEEITDKGLKIETEADAKNLLPLKDQMKDVVPKSMLSNKMMAR